MKPVIKRCAIYTRKSSEEGLEQEFNSLHAQREACESYILSQKHEGWSKVKTCYDDGGFSGGSLKRPALEELMNDIKAGKIDSVVVYKIDRLTRSLMDFSKLVEVFDQHNVTFVSITQSFNTTTSMGRLTLNVLLSFAQFEREVTGERIRDKIAASKKKGMWMGGNIPLGYNLKDRQLILNPNEAEKVRLIFKTYLKLGNVRELKGYLEKNNVISAARISNKGNISGNKLFSRGHLYKILSNRIYIGQIEHKDLVHEGQHEAIIDLAIWEAVQKQLKAGSIVKAGKSQTRRNNILQGKLFDPDGIVYTPTYTKKGSRQYRYYISQNLLQYKNHPKRLIARIPAQEIENTLSGIMKQKLSGAEYFIGLYTELDSKTATQLINYFNKVADISLLGYILKVVISPDRLDITMDTHQISKIIVDEFSISLSESGPRETVFSTAYNTLRDQTGKVIIQPEGKSKGRLDLPMNTLKKLVQGTIWREEHFKGSSLQSIAKTNDCSWTYVSNCIDLSFNY